MAVVDTPVPTGPSQPPPPQPPAATGWSGGRIVSVVLGSLLVVLSFVFMVVGTAGLAWNATQRQDGYLTSAAVRVSSDGYAVTSDRVQLGSDTVDWGWQRRLIGDVRVRAEATDAGRALFVGIGPTVDVDRYLSAVQTSRVRRVDGDTVRYVEHAGGAPVTAPTTQTFWVAQAAGTGRQSVEWTARSGDWTVVVMNAVASRPVSARVDVGATVPALPWVAGGLLVGGLLVAVAGVLLIAVPLHRISRGKPAVPGAAVGVDPTV